MRKRTCNGSTCTQRIFFILDNAKCVESERNRMGKLGFLLQTQSQTRDRDWRFANARRSSNAHRDSKKIGWNSFGSCGDQFHLKKKFKLLFKNCNLILTEIC